MKKILLLAVVIFSAGTAGADQVLTGCGGLAYPPFMWKQGDKTVGMGPEVAEIIFREIDIKVESKAFSSWNRCLQEVKKGRVDLIFAASANEQRKAFADFTENYLSEIPLAVFVWKEKAFKFEKIQDLTGKKMGRILGTAYDKEFDSFAAKNLEISDVISPLQNFKKLEKGRIDFFPTGLYAGQIQIKKSGYSNKIIPLKPYLKTGYLYMAMSKKSGYLKYLPHADKKLKELRENGELARLTDKYIDYYITNTE
ncbi:MAG: amino acid ABC transporter substrate-binding protein [Desulfobacterales bacterium]|nr:amino acid ABC transporter substrate-binding protein [Desulfobacterales bacterium]